MSDINIKVLIDDYRHARECVKERKYKTSASKYIYEGQMMAYGKILSQIDPERVADFWRESIDDSIKI